MKQKYAEHINKLINEPFNPNSIYKRTIIGDNHNSEDNYYEELKYIMTKYFFYNNGFLGNDIFQLKSSLFETLQSLYISSEENNIEDSEGDVLTNFYNVLNCIYNIKDKFLYFTRYVKNKETNKLEFKKSILSESGKTNVFKKFETSYKVLKKYIDARNVIVHGKYDLSYNKERKEITIISSPFNLSLEPIKSPDDRIKYVFIIDDENVKKLMSTIYNLRNDLFKVLLDKENILLKELKGKFFKNNKSLPIYH